MPEKTVNQDPVTVMRLPAIITGVFRALTGLLFIFSGLIKINDPLGFSYKLEEYSVAFNLKWVGTYSLLLSVSLCVLEIVLGVAILLGMKSKLVTRGLLALIIFFAFLTFYSAWFHKVTECGCFGDAIPMTQWQSFSKNVFLLLMIVYMCRYYKLITPLLGASACWSAVLLSAFIAIYIGHYTINHLPVFDFLPYKIGNHLPDLMKIPRGAPTDEFEITYTLKNNKTGVTRQLSDKEYLATKIYENKDWKYISASEPVLVKAGYQAPLKDFIITDAMGVDHTDEIVNNQGYELLYIEYDLHHTDPNIQSRLNDLATTAQEFNVRTVGITAESTQDVELFCKKVNTMYEVFYCDAIPLEMIVRANPGIVLLHNGTVVNKWQYADLPSYKEFKETYFQHN